VSVVRIVTMRAKLRSLKGVRTTVLKKNQGKNEKRGGIVPHTGMVNRAKKEAPARFEKNDWTHSLREKIQV